jgi:hypothetical protein
LIAIGGMLFKAEANRSSESGALHAKKLKPRNKRRGPSGSSICPSLFKLAGTYWYEQEFTDHARTTRTKQNAG